MVELTAKCCCRPSHDGALGVIGISGMASLNRRTGHIASDIDIDWNGKPLFLIDATTKSGMSGSPVVAKRVCICQTSKTNQIGNAVKFLGVYSGREIGTSVIEVGFVWKPRVILEILRHGQKP